jgi:hypothetical protein
MDIPGNHGKIGVLLHQKTFVPPLVEMSGSAVATIERRGVADIEVAHELTEIPKRRLDQQMKMVAHQDKTVELNRINGKRAGKYFEKFLPVDVVLEDGLALIATVGDMIQGARIFDAKRSCHS